ncbi:MAG: tripartite tricarboxylate transporter TctB family protein [Rhizobiaceae bacterium]|nr:tripartite tricarboxylate transporter TctB family protein [Rhizobiaceae bacterium]
MERVFPIALICAGAMAFYTARSYPKSMFSPVDPGTFPSLLAAGVMVCGLLLLIGTFRKTAQPVADEDASANMGMSEFMTGVALIGVLILLALSFDVLGFIESCGAVAVALAYLQSRRIIASIVTGVLVVAVVYVVFKTLLAVPLP